MKKLKLIGLARKATGTAVVLSNVLKDKFIVSEINNKTLVAVGVNLVLAPYIKFARPTGIKNLIYNGFE